MALLFPVFRFLYQPSRAVFLEMPDVWRLTICAVGQGIFLFVVECFKIFDIITFKESDTRFLLLRLINKCF